MPLSFKFNSSTITLSDNQSDDNQSIIDLTPILDPYIINNIQIGNQTISVENDMDLTPALDAAIEDYLNQNINPKFLKVGNELYTFNNGIPTLDITNPIVDIIKDQFEPIKAKIKEQKGDK